MCFEIWNYKLWTSGFYSNKSQSMEMSIRIERNVQIAKSANTLRVLMPILHYDVKYFQETVWVGNPYRQTYGN